MSACIARFAVSLLAAVALAVPAISGEGTESDPLGEEDIVRAWVAGKPAEELVEWIRGAEVAFDLSDEMVSELRRAGLPEAVLQAMLASQEQPGVAGEAAVAPEPGVAATLTVRLNPQWKPTEKAPRPALRMLDAIDGRTRESLGLREGAEHFTDVAIFLICRTAPHVPDHWRMHSPLGRDFRSAPRHKMLVFVGGAERMEPGAAESLISRLLPGSRTKPADSEAGVLELVVPAELEVELDPLTTHDLTLGIAVQAADRYYMVAADSWDGVEVAAGGVELLAELSGTDGGGPGDLAAEFTRDRNGTDGIE
jgi:hypothetical protein